MTGHVTRAERKRIQAGDSRHSVLFHLALGLLSAMITALSYPRYGFWPMIFFALWPVGYLAVVSRRLWRLGWTVLVVQVAWWLVMIYWLVPVTVGGYIALSILMGVYSTLGLMMLNRCHYRWPAIPAMCTLPAAWVCVELVRANWPEGGFAWFALAHALVDIRPGHEPSRLLQVADLFGVQAVTFLIAMSAGLLIDISTCIGRAQLDRVGKKVIRTGVSIRTLVAELGIYLLVIMAAWLYGQHRIGQSRDTTSHGPYVCSVQTNVPQDNRNYPELEQLIRDWNRLLDITELAAQSSPRPELIIWPETATPPVPLNPAAIQSYLGDEDPHRRLLTVYHEQIRDLTVRFRINLVVGATAHTDQGRYNSAYLYHAGGIQDPLRYDKIHLVPFGEYTPWIDTLPGLKALFFKYISPYDFDYTLTPGEGLTVFESYYRPAGSSGRQVVRFTTPICYEDVDTSLCRRMVYGPGGKKRVDMLVNLTNSAWYSGYDQRPQHLQIAACRAVENRVPVVRSVNTGISGIINSLGAIVTQVEVDGNNQFIEGFVTERVELDNRTTLYGRQGRWPMVTVSLLFLLLVSVAVLTGLRATDKRVTSPMHS